MDWDSLLLCRKNERVLHSYIAFLFLDKIYLDRSPGPKHAAQLMQACVSQMFSFLATGIKKHYEIGENLGQCVIYIHPI
jgi:hypothetical protein